MFHLSLVPPGDDGVVGSPGFTGGRKTEAARSGEFLQTGGSPTLVNPSLCFSDPKENYDHSNAAPSSSSPHNPCLIWPFSYVLSLLFNSASSFISNYSFLYSSYLSDLHLSCFPSCHFIFLLVSFFLPQRTLFLLFLFLSLFTLFLHLLSFPRYFLLSFPPLHPFSSPSPFLSLYLPLLYHLLLFLCALLHRCVASVRRTSG